MQSRLAVCETQTTRGDRKYKASTKQAHTLLLVSKACEAEMMARDGGERVFSD